MQTEIRINQNQVEEISGLTMEYPYTMHRDNIRVLQIPWHWHEEIEIGYVEAGAVEITTATKRYTFRAGEAYFMNGNVLSYADDGRGSEPGILVCHIFHPVFLGGHFRSVFETKYLSPVLSDKSFEILELREKNPRQKKILRRIRELTKLQEQENVEFQTRSMLSGLWLLLVEELMEEKSRRATDGTALKPVNQERIQSMLAYIHRHYGEKLTLDGIARAASVSRRECLRCFQDIIRKSPFEYLKEYRVQRAELMLQTTGKTMTEIALECGFSGAAYFGKTFRELRGMTPGEFRNRNRMEKER